MHTLINQLSTSRKLFADGIQHCYDGGKRIFLEVGPSPVLLGALP